MLDEVLPGAWHRTDRYANDRIEADHGRLKARLRPMRGLKQDQSTRAITAGHALVQNVRRGHYELVVEAPATRRVAVAFDELAAAICSEWTWRLPRPLTSPRATEPRLLSRDLDDRPPWGDPEQAIDDERVRRAAAALHPAEDEVRRRYELIRRYVPLRLRWHT